LLATAIVPAILARHPLAMIAALLVLACLTAAATVDLAEWLAHYCRAKGKAGPRELPKDETNAAAESCCR
jgi:hypothetical protein